MKLAVHASIFSVIFAGFVASALTTKHTVTTTPHHVLIISHGMPVPTCDPCCGCPVRPE
jgi:hypothetical protein